MGANSRRRRQSRERRRPPQGPSRECEKGPWGTPDPPPDLAARAAALLAETVRRALAHPLDPEHHRRVASALLARLPPVPPRLLRAPAERLLRGAVTDVLTAGWGATDLGEVLRRQADPQARGVVAHALDQRGDDHDLGTPTGPRPDTPDGLAVVLRALALLAVLPRVVGGARCAATGQPAHPKLARVRALLAKAESTQYPEEAEALTAKAQELITRYALERLVAQDTADPTVTARRIWLDPPYVEAKADLVAEVAAANRCRSAVCGPLGFCSVVGDPADLDLVELLATSLLVQATVALQHHGQVTDRWGVSRTRSFRRSFLVAFASRIGQRLRAASAEVVEESADDRWLPVLRAQEERVREAFEQMLPDTRVRETTSVSNGEGWAAGRAAADRADLAVRRRVEGRP